jgi:predicted RNA-binding Zn ribbon-like protein
LEVGSVTEQKHLFALNGNNLALDLVNTERLIRRKRTDLLRTVEDLHFWWSTACKRHEGEMENILKNNGLVWDEGLLAAVQSLRSALRNIFAALTAGLPVPAADVHDLNMILATGHPMITIQGMTGGYISTDERHGGILLPIALSAYRILTGSERERVRACPNCIAFFYDISKSHTRRWCSEKCMNRARSIQRFAALKQKRLSRITHSDHTDPVE